jgi:hypothetical protein
MNLQSLVAIAEIVSALAVSLTLAVLVVSIRQNTRSQKLLAVDSLAAAIAAINVPAMESPTLGSALSKATKDWGAANREERIVAHYFLFSFFKLVENAWYQQRSGVLDRAQWTGWERMIRAYYHSEGVRRVWWPNRQGYYSPEFQKFLSETQPPTETDFFLSAIFDDPKRDTVA